MPTNISEDKGHAPSSGQVTKIPEKASTSAIIEMLCKNRLSEFERVTKQLKVATELKKKTRLREFVKAQHWTFHFWVERNKSFLQKNTSVKDTNRSPCIPPEPSLAKRRRQNRARVRLQIMNALEWIGSPLSEISEILDGRPQWEDRQSWDSDSDSGSTLVDGGRFESEIEVHVKNLERFNNILLLWTKMIGDEGPAVKGMGAVIQADRDVMIDEGLETKVPAKKSACAIVESGRDRSTDQESGAKGPAKKSAGVEAPTQLSQADEDASTVVTGDDAKIPKHHSKGLNQGTKTGLKKAVVQMLRKLLKRISGKKRSERNAHSKDG